MISLPFVASSAQPSQATQPLLLANPKPQPNHERLLHLVIGSPDGVRSVIHTLHLLRYAEQGHWTRLFTIQESGLIITPEQGEVFSLLRRERSVY